VTIPDPVQAVCDTWLLEVGQRAPGLVTGLYLRGGLGFGEYVAGKSDVDFVATLSRRPSSADLAAIEAAHGVVHERHPDLPFDGAHVLATDLASSPDSCPDVPTILHRLFNPEGREDISPVAWHELAHHGITVFGQDLSTLDIWTSDDALRAFTVDNLDTYWRANAESCASSPVEAGADWVCEWCVLGVARLHHLLVTGQQTTKSAAGRWGLTYYEPRFHRVLREARRIREGGTPEYDEPVDRGTDVAAFTAYVVERGTDSTASG
jgi:hypothetical protein